MGAWMLVNDQNYEKPSGKSNKRYLTPILFSPYEGGNDSGSSSFRLRLNDPPERGVTGVAGHGVCYLFYYFLNPIHHLLIPSP